MTLAECHFLSGLRAGKQLIKSTQHAGDTVRLKAKFLFPLASKCPVIDGLITSLDSFAHATMFCKLACTPGTVPGARSAMMSRKHREGGGSLSF